MTQDELNQLIAQHGGLVGTTATGPKDEPNPDVSNIDSPNFDPSAPKRRAVYNPPYDYQFKDGSHITLRAKVDEQGNANESNGFDVVKNITLAPGATASANANVRTVRGANGQDQIEVRDPSDPSGLTWVAVGGTVSNPDEDQIKAIQRQILEGQRTERETNAANGKGYLTNDQVATIDRDAQANKTSAADVQIRKDQLAQTAKDAEVTAGLRQQEINNTATNQQADIQLRQNAQKAQTDAQNAANALAAKRLELDSAVQNNTMTLDNAKFEYQKQYDAAQQAVQQATLLQTQVTEADRRAEAAQTNATTVRGQDLTAANELANRQATAASTALTEAENGGKTGADILNQRATNARDTLNQTLAPVENSKNFGLGGGLPAGFGSTLLGGISDWTAQMAGGQDVLKTAQDLVHNANPTLAGTPAGAAWSAVLQQMLGAKQSQDAAAGSSFPAPTGSNPATPPAAPAAPAAPGPASTLPGQITPDQFGNQFVQSDQPEGGNRNPVTVNPDGTVAYNFHFYPPTGTQGGAAPLGGIA